MAKGQKKQCGNSATTFSTAFISRIYSFLPSQRTRNTTAPTNNKNNMMMTTTAPRKQRVRFVDVIVDDDKELAASTPPVLPLPEGMSHRLWYSNSEISNFKREIGTVLLRKVLDNKCSTGGDDDKSDLEALWGLERHCVQRDHAKKAGIRLVLLAYRKLNKVKEDSEFLRSISLKCSERAHEMALQQGFQDSWQAYHEEDLVPKTPSPPPPPEMIVDECILDSIPAVNTFDLPVCGYKRPMLVDESEFGRRVRQRASTICERSMSFSL